MSKKKFWCAASTHNKEELLVGKVHKELKLKNKNLITVIIPRHINRVKQIIAEINELGLNVVSRSTKKLKLKGIDIFIVDTFGETKKTNVFSNSENFIGLLSRAEGNRNPYSTKVSFLDLSPKYIPLI